LGTYTRSHSFSQGEIPTETQWNVDIDGIIAVLNGQIDEGNVDYTSADGIVTMQNAQTITGAKTFTSATQLSNTVTVGVDDTGYDVQFFGATSGKSMLWDESADKLIITGDMSVSGTSTLTDTVTATAGITSGSNIVSDTDSTDDLGTSSVRWATSYTDDSVGRFIANDPTIATDKTLTSTYNWGTFGPVTIDSGITITIASGATWTVV